MKIIKIHARQVIDSRGNPTIEVEIYNDRCVSARAIVPSGASTGEREACELRDKDSKIYNGLSVNKAVNNVNKIIGPKIIEKGFYATQQREIDKFLIDLDGTEFKKKLGANAILGVSMAIAKLGAKTSMQKLFKYLGGCNGHTLPTPMLNIINGGAHADNAIDFQEFMIIPIGAKNIEDAIRYSSEVYHSLKNILKKNGYSTLIGDEGGFAPNCKSIEETLDLLCSAIKKAGYIPTSDYKKEKGIAIALDVAASELYIKSGSNKGSYHFKKLSKFIDKKIIKSQSEMIVFYEKLIKKFPIISIEDPFDENDWKGFQKLTSLIGDKVQIVGDDLFVTNCKYLKKGIELKAANSILIKLNQIGTITETIEAIEMAKSHGWTAIISHRSGETEDTTIADLAVGLNTGLIKTGSMARTDRVAKYNQLLRISSRLDKQGIYLGGKSFYNFK